MPKPKTNPKPAQSEDRRIRRTYRHLRSSLVTLILERGWDAVTVRDICEHADVGRSTFYLHFADKENLLLSGFDELRAGLEQHRRQSSLPFAFAEPLLAHAAENEGLFRAIAGRQSGQQVQWLFHDLLLTLIGEDLAAAKVPAARRPAVAAFLSGGLLGLMMTWLEGRKREPPEELARVFRELAVKSAALR